MARLQRIGASIELTVSDDGVGIKSDGAGALANKLGTKILNGLTRKLNGVIEFETGPSGTLGRVVMSI